MKIKELNQGGQMTDSTNSIKAYRPDIDGLRAIAVLAVLVFHCFPTLLSGGFVGVDVFFVISGYLIGRSSFDEMADGTYSASAYFGRRARRIFPALLVVLVAILLTAWWILLPVEFQLLGKHVAGASVFISNWQFWREVGYFNTEATLKPLLHLWSLAVEEQFYLLFPLILIFSRRSARSPLLPLIVVALICFASVSWRLADHKAWAYFHLFSRGWELLVGVFLAFAESRLAGWSASGPRLPLAWRTPCAGLGLAMLLGSAWGYSSVTPFPGFSALLPTLGAGMVIAAGSATAFNRLLALRPLVYIGLISYPLYLWHWPILSMLRIVDGNGLDGQTRLAVFLISIVLASLTYHLVERPLRKAALAQWRFFPLLLWACLLSVGGAGYFIFIKGGLPERFTGLDTTQQPASARQVLPPKDFASQKKAILLGDSHAMMYSTALRSYFFRVHQKELIDAFRAGCKPFYNLDKHTPGRSPHGCPKSMNPGIEQAINDPQVDAVVIVTALVSFTYSVYPGLEEAPSPDPERNRQIVSQAIDDTFAMLAASGKQIIVFYTTPMLRIHPSECQTRPFRWRSEARSDCYLSAEQYADQQKWSREKLTEISKRYPNIHLFDPAQVLCREGRCEARMDGKLIYSDGAHLNASGAERVAEKFDF